MENKLDNAYKHIRLVWYVFKEPHLFSKSDDKKFKMPGTSDKGHLLKLVSEKNKDKRRKNNNSSDNKSSMPYC